MTRRLNEPRDLLSAAAMDVLRPFEQNLAERGWDARIVVAITNPAGDYTVSLEIRLPSLPTDTKETL